MPETNVKPEKSKLCRIIAENLPGASIVAGPRRYFREELGMDYINQVLPRRNFELTTANLGRRSRKCQSRDIGEVFTEMRETNNSYYAISAAAAIVKST